jgi:hypothetical protein
VSDCDEAARPGIPDMVIVNLATGDESVKMRRGMGEVIFGCRIESSKCGEFS